MSSWCDWKVLSPEQRLKQFLEKWPTVLEKWPTVLPSVNVTKRGTATETALGTAEGSCGVNAPIVHYLQ